MSFNLVSAYYLMAGNELRCDLCLVAETLVVVVAALVPGALVADDNIVVGSDVEGQAHENVHDGYA